MSRRDSRLAGAVALVLLLACVALWHPGFYPRLFDLEWDEQVLLHDGRTTVMHVRNSYERTGSRWTKYADAAFRGNEVTFDAGGGERVTLRSRLEVSHIDQVGGQWYAVLVGQGPYGPHSEDPPDHWGTDFTMKEERLATLRDDRFVPIAWDLAPPGSMVNSNRLVGSMPLDVLGSFDHGTITLQDKQRLRAMYPPGPGAGVISRPHRMVAPVQAAPGVSSAGRGGFNLSQG